jgi:hypothetical protein
MMIPFAAFVYGVELFAQAVQESSRTASRGLEAVTGSAFERSQRSDGQRVQTPELERLSPWAEQTTANQLQQEPRIEIATTKKEKLSMSYDGGTRRDKDLQDDMLKLVRYKILFVRREYEHAFDEKEDLVYDSMDGAAFAAWKVAEFIQDLHKGKTLVPDKWHKFLKPHHIKDGKWLMGLDDDDKKYLRVYYEVLERYTREKFKYEEQQIEILRDIAHNVKDLKSGGGGSSGGSSASGGGSHGTGGGSTGAGGSSSAAGGGSEKTHVNPGAPGGGLAGPGPTP